MFYLLYLQFAELAQDYPLLNLLQYQTVRVGLALFTGLFVAIAMGSRFIAWMRAKQGRGQKLSLHGLEAPARNVSTRSPIDSGNGGPRLLET